MYKPFFHVGILVPNVEAAAADFSARLGLEFEPTRTGQVASGEEMRYRYSLQGPPYLELVEMTGEGIWAPEGAGLHHIAFAEPDIERRCAIFDDLADEVVPGEDGTPRVVFTRPEALHGVRVEYLTDATVASTLERVQSLHERHASTGRSE